MRASGGVLRAVGDAPYSPEELYGRETALERFRRINATVSGWIHEVEISGQLLGRLIAVGLGIVGALRIFGIG